MLVVISAIKGDKTSRKVIIYKFISIVIVKY